MTPLVQEIGDDIKGQYPHPVYELTIYELVEEVRDAAAVYDLTITEQEFLAIAAWVGFDAYENEELLDVWRA